MADPSGPPHDMSIVLVATCAHTCFAKRTSTPFCSQRGAQTAGVRFTNRAPPKSAPQLSEQNKQFAYMSTNHKRQSNTLNVLQSKVIQRQKRRQELEFATMHSATLVFVWL